MGCQVCGETKVLAGTPDRDGVARVTWFCAKCGAGQLLRLQVSADASGASLRRIIGGLSLAEAESGEDDGESMDELQQ